MDDVDFIYIRNSFGESYFRTSEMPIIRSIVSWAMQSAKRLSFARTITTFKPKCTVIMASSPPCLVLDSYCESNAQEGVYSKNREIDDLIKSGQLNSALNLFDEMLVRDVVTYNLLISGYGQYGLPKQALYFYDEMVSQGIRESPSTCSSVLAVCRDGQFYKEGSQVHCRVLTLGFSFNLFVSSSLVDLYMHMGLDNIALKLFNELPERNLAMWNLVLRGYCDLDRSDELLGLYSKMELDGVEPNGLTFCYLFRGCSNEKLLDGGKQLHCQVVKVGWLLGKRPSIRSFARFLNLSSGMTNIQLGKQIHSYVLKLGYDHGSIHIQSALIDMYGKCWDIESSVTIYNCGPERTLECCNSLMTSLLHCGITEDVVEMFGLMVDKGVGLDEVTFSTTLKALSVSASTSFASCRLLHCCAIKSGFESDNAVACSLIDAYSRCGHIELSRIVFDKIPSPNVICFTSLINGYARNGMGREGLEMLQALVQKGLKPDRVAFLCALTGCSYSGLVKEGRLLFDSMKTLHGIDPDRQHYSCTVDLLGRAGLLDEAEELLQMAPGKGDGVMWSSLLRSCRVHGNEIVGRRVAKTLLEIEPEDPAVCLQVSNFYSEIGEFHTSTQLRKRAMSRKVTRKIGHSLIEVNCLN
ncbi:putative pentatricopeptide repeat-containing protein At3g05240 isoform X2 [Carya illinoinensis]|uniref:putative pentatricopeptide repeat-containing protein At3g05240 isoform X2 n=1 Tax=Carya illinoinensis TaxID=32201 RepID=UPI001C72627B|nr:putative pentatricopeptide repeat-containing protein At3g05240 isoform X2 [Carya illinoinensis]